MLSICEEKDHKLTKVKVFIPNAGHFISEICEYCGETLLTYNIKMDPNEVERIKKMYKEQGLI